MGHGRHVLEEHFEVPFGIGSDIVKLFDEAVSSFGADGGRLEGRGLVLEEIAIVCGRKLKLHI